MLTRFWGGAARKSCVQVTDSTKLFPEFSTDTGYISLTRSEAWELSLRLREFALGQEQESAE